MYTVLALHVCLAAVSLALPRLGRRSMLVVGLAPLVTFVWALTQVSAVADGDVQSQTLQWVSDLGLSLTLGLDPLALVMTLLVSGVGIAVFLFAYRYMGDDGGTSRLAGLLALFAASMLGLVFSIDLLGLFVFWEATTVVSFLLVGFDDERPTARAAAWKALLVTGAGGLALLLGVVVLGITEGTWTVAELAADPPGATGWAAVAAIGVLAGAFTKSAQVPAHGWLLGAMAAPTPVSSYLHSATMVTAGVWLTVRLDPVFSSLDWWHPTLLVVGGASALWGGVRAMSAVDLKRLLAYSTISALGLMFAIIGIGTPKSLFAALAVLVAHALYKAALFMGAGTIDHETGTRDLRELGGLRGELPWTAASMGLAALSMAAVPATAGFVAKEAAVVAGVDGASALSWAGVVVIAASGVLAVAYAWRLWAGVFLGARPSALRVHSPSPAMWAPPLVLGALGVLLGIVPSPLSTLVADAAGSVREKAGVYDLLAWPGLGTALAISLGVLVLGALLATRARGTDRTPELVDRFDPFMAGLFRTANRITAITQPGSLPIYVGTIALVATVPAIGLLLVDTPSSPTDSVLASSTSQAVAATLAIVSAAGVAALRNRIAAVIALGAVGYCVAGLFWVQGAPDLALTQVLVETVVVAVFVLVFRRLPARFAPRRATTASRLARIGISVGVAAAIGVLVVATAGQPRVGPTPTETIVADAEPVGGGRNVVNVILTDVRALDTLGEITVVAAAALGALALGGLAGTRLGRRDRSDDGAQVPVLTPDRSIALDTLVRGAFPFVVTFSLFMLVAGHNAPGGGFIAGLIAAAAVSLRLLAGDWGLASDRPRWLQPQPLIGIGLMVAALTLVAGALMGGFGDQGVTTWSLPLLGKVKATTALVFDVGVYLLVVGATVAILDALSAPADDEAQEVRP